MWISQIQYEITIHCNCRGIIIKDYMKDLPSSQHESKNEGSVDQLA